MSSGNPLVYSDAIRREFDVPVVSHSPMDQSNFDMFQLSIHTDIGGRKYQEDRFTFCPTLISGRKDSAFFGVFDGTVGNFASETVKSLVVPQLVGSPSWRRLLERLSASPSQCNSADAAGNTTAAVPNGTPATSTNPTTPSTTSGTNSTDSNCSQLPIDKLIGDAVTHMYRHADAELVHECAVHQKDYASSTSVTAILAAGYLAVGHLGDSRIALGRAVHNSMVAEFLTNDHKPDQPIEKERIMMNGGSVEYLHNHNNRPFIRGGDFTMRKSRGEQPMQLQYSRAFGVCVGCV
eukprot:GHVQ01006086.1.p1 GENE.GHVQ01006086.1~~GHVQ01006086.1.p1  ORF type:complete len:293 (+),score=46.16 GHVQ01006086.1:661-1539(+)